jgi:20S proteasome alpha/beta subunit
MLERSSIVNGHHKPPIFKRLGMRFYSPLREEWEYRPILPRGEPMTVCIAALCEGARNIVVCADKMIGSAFMQADTKVFKIVRLNEANFNLVCMYAGNDIAPVEDIIHIAQTKFLAVPNPTQAEARAIVASAYMEVRLKKAEEHFLVGRNLTMNRFTKEGRILLGDQLFSQIDRQIMSMAFDIELLVAGFDSVRGFIFSVCNPGEVVPYFVPGFHAIGSGQINALSSLSQRKIDPTSSLQSVAYAVYEAKRYAELVGGVGKSMDFFVMRPNEHGLPMSATVKALEDIWELHKPKDLGAEEIAKLGKFDCAWAKQK